MNTKIIFKTLAFAMLMPAMMLTTACSNDDDLVNNTANTETVANKGYALPVTVNVTREDGATRATYNESTRKLEFSTGDKLFVEGMHTEAARFAGTLDYDTEKGNFSGTIYTQNSYSGTADALLTDASASGIVNATLLPNGYESYNFLSIYNNGSDDLYDDVVAWKSFCCLRDCKENRRRAVKLGESIYLQQWFCSGAHVCHSQLHHLRLGGWCSGRDIIYRLWWDRVFCNRKRDSQCFGRCHICHRRTRCTRWCKYKRYG